MNETSLKDITIIITSFHSDEIISKCLDSIDEKYPVIIVENSNNIKFKKDIEEKYKNVECIINNDNLGYGKANNIGISKTKTKYVLILNPDTLLLSDTLEKLMLAAKKIKNFAILAPTNVKEENLNENNQIEIKKSLDKNIKYSNIENSVDEVKGFAMLLKLDEFENIGFFDENFFIYFEEIDLCRRAILKGKKIYKLFDVKVNHSGGRSHNVSINTEMELSRNWHWMWSTFYYYKKYDGYLLAFIKVFRKFISSIFKSFFFAIILKKEKSLLYKQRMSGLLNSMIGKKAWYRPKVIFNDQEN